MPLPKRARAGSAFDKVMINVFDINTKQIVCTGSYSEVAKFLNTTSKNISTYLKNNSKFKKRYALRFAKTDQ